MQDILENSYLITIVVPIYNVERYLPQCLDSLLYQTRRNHYVILVNDGSTDSSGEIAKQYANQYPDLFTYFEQNNKGLGAARNAGLRLVKTEMTGFLDSDDWVPKTYVERLSKRLENDFDLPDLMYTHPVVLDSASHEFYEWNDYQYYSKIFEQKNTITNAKLNPWILALEPSANIKLYRTAFLRQCDFSFPEGTKWEDVEPHFKLLHLADRCIYENSTGFIYRTNTGSQITSSVGFERLQIVTVFSRALNKAFTENWPSVEISFILRMLYNFSKWSINFCTLEVRKQLIAELHELYTSIPGDEWNRYFNFFGVSRRDRMYINVLISSNYKLLMNPVKIDAFNIYYKKIRRIIH